MSPVGKVLNQNIVKSMATEYENLCILCGHYEGVDQRVLDLLVDEEISVGDYVLTGGELPAMVLTDAVCRMLPGVLSMMNVLQKKVITVDYWNILNIQSLPFGGIKRYHRCFCRVTMLTLTIGAVNSH